MAEGSVEERVKTIIVDELGVDESEVTSNARFIDDLGADSLDTVELVMRFEEEFKLRFLMRTLRRLPAFATPSITLASMPSSLPVFLLFVLEVGL